MRVTLIGHPFSSLGMGQQLRSCFAALQAVQIACEVIDVFRYAPRGDPDHAAMIVHEVERPSGDVRLFHVNGDEVDAVLAALSARGIDFAGGRNIIMPAWELPRYPEAWAEKLRRFDAVWAMSEFVRGSLAAAGIDARVVGQSVDVARAAFLPRRHFGIRESAIVLLNFYDSTSYAARKNPRGVEQMMTHLRRLRPKADLQFVLKAKNGDQTGDMPLARAEDVLLIDRPLSGFETHSLLRCADLYVSLHRAEGFGRVLGEAMMLGAVAVGTGWSGNVDFMDKASSILVRHRLTGIAAGAYPFCQGQQWAEPDPLDAAQQIAGLLDDPDKRRALGAAGRRQALLVAGNRAVGLRMLAALKIVLQ